MSERIDGSKVDMAEVSKRFAPILQEYYDSLHIRPDTIREKILAIQQFLGEGGFCVYGGGETPEIELTALEHIFLFKRGLVY